MHKLDARLNHQHWKHCSMVQDRNILSVIHRQISQFAQNNQRRS